MASDEGPPCTVFRLRKAARKATRAYDQHMAATGIGIAQFGVLRVIAGADGASMSTIADVLDMDRTTLTRNVQPLIRDGLVTVGAGGDGRTRAVRITGEGRKALATAQGAWREAQARLRKSLGAAELDQLHALLSRLVERLPDD
ncbi:MAG: winged helix-turn-helix transcriptional regulator [Hyphomicrobiaceae bacterium]|nr:winged helix-turn-helix transcriptional regulator [Hyphomicrobiaceae bacterium]